MGNSTSDTQFEEELLLSRFLEITSLPKSLPKSKKVIVPAQPVSGDFFKTITSEAHRCWKDVRKALQYK